MFAIGKIPLKAQRLIEVTYEGMMRGIEIVVDADFIGLEVDFHRTGPGVTGGI